MLVPESMEFGDLDALGAREFWIVDAEEDNPTESSAIIRSACPPMMVAPGYKTVAIGARAGQHPTPIPGTTAQPGYRPGFLSPPGMPTMAGLNDLGFFTVMSPDGAMVAAFRCRPFYATNEMAITQSAGGFRTLVQRGAAESPEGTARLRTRMLRTVKR